MREFRVTLHQKAGEFARLAELVSRRGLNLKSVAGIAEDHKAIICLVCEDVAGLRETLQEARIQFEEAELLTHLMEDRAGELSALASKLAEAGVNMASLYVLAREAPLIEVGFTVDDPKKAKKALGI
jgi:acetolactate synthase small subunit